MSAVARLVKDWRAVKDNLRATNLAFAAAVGRNASDAERLSLAREVARLMEEERRHAIAAGRLRRAFFWIPSTLPSVLG